MLLRRSLAADVLVVPRLMRRGLAGLTALAPGLAAGAVRFALVSGDPAAGGLSVAPGRDGVRLREVDHMSWDAVADAMHYSRAQCYRYHTRARDKLRERGYSAG